MRFETALAESKVSRHNPNNVQESATRHYRCVATEGADALKSLRYQGLHIEIKHLESGVPPCAHRRGEGRLKHNQTPAKPQ